jgi:hypothetical protein
MAVTTPGLLQPDSLTVTISQIPGVSLTLEIGWGGSCPSSSSTCGSGVPDSCSQATAVPL